MREYLMVFHTYADIQSGIMVVCHGAFRDRAVILLASRGPPGRAAIYVDCQKTQHLMVCPCVGIAVGSKAGSTM